MLAEKPCRILTDVNYTYSVSVFLIRRSRGTLLACLAVCPVAYLQDCHSLPRRTLQYSHERELPKLLLVKALCESNARMTDHHLLAFWLLCAMLAPQRICVSLGDGDQYPQAVTCEHPISACGLRLHPPCQQPGQQCHRWAGPVLLCWRRPPTASRLPRGHFAVSVWCKGTTQ